MKTTSGRVKPNLIKLQLPFCKAMVCVMIVGTFMLIRSLASTINCAIHLQFILQFKLHEHSMFLKWNTTYWCFSLKYLSSSNHCFPPIKHIFLFLTTRLISQITRNFTNLNLFLYGKFSLSLTTFYFIFFIIYLEKSQNH